MLKEWIKVDNKVFSLDFTKELCFFVTKTREEEREEVIVFLNLNYYNMSESRYQDLKIKMCDLDMAWA